MLENNHNYYIIQQICWIINNNECTWVSLPTRTDTALWRGSYGLFPFPSSTLEGSILNTLSWRSMRIGRIGFEVWSHRHFASFCQNILWVEILVLRNWKLIWKCELKLRLMDLSSLFAMIHLFYSISPYCSFAWVKFATLHFPSILWCTLTKNNKNQNTAAQLLL